MRVRIDPPRLPRFLRPRLPRLPRPPRILPVRRPRVRIRLLPRLIPFRDRNPVVIGAAGLTTLTLLTFAAFNADSLPLIGGGRTYSAAFSEAGGLKPGDEVRIAGVKVGKVEEVDLDGDHVKVTFKVKGELALRRRPVRRSASRRSSAPNTSRCIRKARVS